MCIILHYIISLIFILYMTFMFDIGTNVCMFKRNIITILTIGSQVLM